MTSLERTIAQLSGPTPAATVSRNAVGGLVALALPIGGALLGVKLAGSKGAVGGAIVGIVGAFAIMAKLTAATTSEI